ncbi:MAG: 50S ribosomal protein L6 [Planctomycetes bacterium]|nr:50S ribosomal protein L6 [Planctomycetota bacterium]
MSRIGKKPVPIPDGVKVFLRDHTLKVEGPLGKLEQTFHPEMKIEIENDARRIAVLRPSDAKQHRALHGLTRTLIANMVQGVTQGYKKELQIEGVGYNAKRQGRELVITIGFCHPVILKIPEGLEVELSSATAFAIQGCDKQKVGQFAAEIHKIRPPDPYKAKGVRYLGEHIRRKAGKKFGSSE